MMERTLSIAGVEIGGRSPCRTVAEISNNHNGDLARAFRLIAAAKDAGADFVKFQAYTPDELVALRGDGPAPDQWGEQGWTMRDLYTKAQTPLEWLPKLAAYCAELGMPWFSSVFGLDSLIALEKVRCPAYKIARLDNEQDGHVAAVLTRGKPTLVSYADSLLVRGYEGLYRVTPLYCPPGYPTAIADVRLPTFNGYNGGFIGLSSHCLDPHLPLAAAARGAALLEYHVQLDDEPSELEANISLTASQFAQMVTDIRATEALLA